MPPGAEQGTPGQPGLGQVFGDGLGRGEAEADASTPVALLVEGEGRLVAVLVEVLDLEPADGADAGPCVEEDLQDPPVAELQDGVAGRPGPSIDGPGGRRGPWSRRVGRMSRVE